MLNMYVKMYVKYKKSNSLTYIRWPSITCRHEQTTV